MLFVIPKTTYNSLFFRAGLPVSVKLFFLDIDFNFDSKLMLPIVINFWEDKLKQEIKKKEKEKTCTYDLIYSVCVWVQLVTVTGKQNKNVHK